MALTADPLDVTNDQSMFWADSRPPYSDEPVSSVFILSLFSIVFVRSSHAVL